VIFRDFEGILFKDITPLLIDPKATKECLEILVSSLKDKKIDKVIGWRVAFSSGC
jgi:adenine phosphoribosyltransferase